MSQTRHDLYLDELVYRLNYVGENLNDVKWIMKDGIWLVEGRQSRRSLCDLIVVYYDGTGVPIELKGSKVKRAKALSQIHQGCYFIEDILGLKCERGKIVYYSRDGYTFESFGRNRL